MFRVSRMGIACAAALAILAAPTLAQGPQGPGGPRVPPGLPLPPKPPTVLDVPMPLLSQALQLSDEQREKIAQIRQEFERARREVMPPPPGPGALPPGPRVVRAALEKVRAIEQEAIGRVLALLTPEQREGLGRLLRDIADFGVTGIPGPVVPRLGLTPEQRQKIAAIAARAREAIRQVIEQGPQAGRPLVVRARIEGIHRQAHEAAMAVLTDEQRAIVAQFLRENPRPEPGGPPPGGFPPPPGGPAGPPPAGGE